MLSRRVGRFHILWRENNIARIKGEGVNQVHQVRCGILEIWVCVTGSTHYVRRMPLKVSSGSDPTYESLDPVSPAVHWSQHPLQDPIHTDRSVFKQSPSGIGIQVYVKWAILCRRWRHGTFRYLPNWKLWLCSDVWPLTNQGRNRRESCRPALAIRLGILH